MLVVNTRDHEHISAMSSSPQKKKIGDVPAKELNPKLTGRRQVRPEAPPYELIENSDSDNESEWSGTEYTESENGGSVPNSARSSVSSARIKTMHKAVHLKLEEMRDMKKSKKVQEEKRKFLMGNNRLKHWGKFIKKEFNVGRPVPFTGLWNCCGDDVDMSLYCLDKNSVRAYIKKIEAVERVQNAERVYREHKMKTVKVPWDEKQTRRLMRHMAAEKADAAGTSFSFGTKNSDEEAKGEEGAGEREKKDAADSDSDDSEPEETVEDRAMAYAESTESSFNAPMLCSWLYKNVTEEPTVISGMQFLQHHLNGGEGCQLMLKHGIVDSLEKIHKHFREHSFLQLQVVIALRKLLDCNYTRDLLIQRDTRVLRLSFAIAHIHMKSREHVDEAIRCVCQCARSEHCRRDIMVRRVFAYVNNICKRFVRDPSILRFSLKFFNWTATNNDRLREISDAGVTATVITVMKRHQENGSVLGPGMLFLTRAAGSHPPAMASILKMKATPVIIRALMALYSDEILQVEGLKMVQTIAKTSEGWKQITETRGGWQSLTQGTNIGNQLVHDLPGALHNRGWAIGDTPHMPFLDRNKIKATETFLAKTKGTISKASWTSHALRDFMGIAMKDVKLKVNTERHDTYFELLETLELLPEPGELREYWYMRLKEYERSNHIELEEMVTTMLELHKKEERKEKEREAAKATTSGEDAAKDVFVRGQLVTAKMLNETDLTLQQLMMGEQAPEVIPDIP